MNTARAKRYDAITPQPMAHAPDFAVAGTKTWRRPTPELLSSTLVTLCAAALTWCGEGLLEAVLSHRDRPVQIESTPGAIWIFADWLRPGLITVVHSFSSRNVRGAVVPAAGAFSTALAALAVAAAMAWAVLRVRTAREPPARLRAALEGVVLVLAAYVTVGKVFCPQYLVWLLPFALVASFLSDQGWWRRTLGLALLVATQLIYPITYASLKAKASAEAGSARSSGPRISPASSWSWWPTGSRRWRSWGSSGCRSG